jgi:exo-beta-1,3-glucanase (GH17 family)
MFIKAKFIVLIIVLLLGVVTATAQNTPPEPRVGINYSLSLPSSGELLPPDQQIVSDMRLIARKVSTIRLYNIVDAGSMIVPLAARENLEVALQVWLTGDSENNEAEIAAAIELAKANPNVIAVLVGEEVLSRGDLEAADLIAYLEQVRAEVPNRVAISYADQLDVWVRHPELAESVDWVGLDSFGFANCQTLEQAARFTVNQWAILLGTPAYADKQVVITETGWPTEGEQSNCSQPIAGSPETQAEFIQLMLETASAAQVDIFLTSFSDEPWRCATAPNARYECHWGLVASDRTPKLAWEQLPAVTRTDNRRILAVVNTEADSANCRSTPNPEGSVVVGIPDGLPVQILDANSEEEWVLVQRTNTQCWMHHSVLAIEGRLLRPRSARLSVSTDNLDDYLASVDLSQCPGEDFGEIVRTTYTAPDVIVFAACVSKLNPWLGDADTQQLIALDARICDDQPSTSTQAAIDSRFQTAWALDSIASAYYNFGLSLRRAGLITLAAQAFETVTNDYSCAWAYGEDAVNGKYFFSITAVAQDQLDTLPLTSSATATTQG